MHSTALAAGAATAIIVLGVGLFTLNPSYKNQIKGIQAPNVLGQRDKETDYRFVVNVPTNLAKGVTVDGEAIFNGDISTPSVNLTGLGSLAGLTDIDETTEITLETSLDLTGDVTGTLGATSIAIGSIEGTMLEDELEYEGDFDFKGKVKADGDEGDDGESHPGSLLKQKPPHRRRVGAPTAPVVLHCGRRQLHRRSGPRPERARP